MRSGFRTSALFAVVALALCAGGAADTSQARASNITTATAKRPSSDGKASELPSAAKRREPAAGSRSANDGARVSPGDDTAGRNIVASRDGEDLKDPSCSADVNGIVCCLTNCENTFDECIQAISYSCPAESDVIPAETKTPFLCLLEFKCCVLNDCVDCKPECCTADDQCENGEQCCDGACISESECCPACDDGEGSDSFCCEGTCINPTLECCTDEQCENGEQCCDGSCIDDWMCCTDDDCRENQYCCGNGKCTNKNKCCDGADTCYAKATAEDLDCCWIEENDRNPFAQGPCGKPTSNPATSFNNWGWTNGPYDLTAESFPSQSLGVYCGAGKCDTGKGFERGTFVFTWDGDTFEARWTATMPDPTAGWELHLGCGTTGVYAKNNRNKFTVAPGQYEFRGTGTETLSLTGTDFAFSTCKELYVIAHFCSTNPGPD